MRPGDRVMTPHGPGTIVGKDLPESRAWRWVVLLDAGPLENQVARCCFKRDLSYEINAGEMTAGHITCYKLGVYTAR